MNGRYFVTSVGTEQGKTYVTRGLALRARRAGATVAALKPLETGVDPVPVDARALALASDNPRLADLPGFYRAEPPLAPAAVHRRGGPCVPPTSALIEAIDGVTADLVLVEGAGGVLVPLDDDRDVRDLIHALGVPAILVARNALGVLSYTLTAHECLDRKGVPVAAVVLNDHGPGDTSREDNHQLLADRLPCPVIRFPACDDNDADLARAADPLWAALTR